jgi:hypothetical protein
VTSAKEPDVPAMRKKNESKEKRKIAVVKQEEPKPKTTTKIGEWQPIEKKM